jgi:anthranilate/para-aminobenzoate synthase component II
MFAGIASPFPAARYHSLQATEIPDVLEVTAWTHDNVAMALAHKTLPVWGLQFHPESFMTPDGPAIVENLVLLTEKAAVL